MSRFLPSPSKISQPFWDSCKARAMQMQKCDDCGVFAFYPVYICPECASRKLTWTRVSGKGTVHTYTVAPKSTFDIEGPMVVALIELEEGAMMTSNIVNVDPNGVTIGMKVKVRYEAVSDDITLPLFEPAGMKLATFVEGGAARPGVVVGSRVVAAPFASMLDLIRGGEEALAETRALAAHARAADGIELSSVRLLAPIPVPAKNVFCVGRNYKLHIEEGARARGVAVEYPPVPEFFSKPPTAVIGTGADIRLPKITRKLDYEVELAFVVARTGRDIPAEKALEHIFGFTVLNDVTARDLQRAHGQWFKGKSLDTSCPMGPFIVTADEFDVRAEHRIWLTVNGERRQDALTSDMLFDCAQILAHLSSGLTVEQGDIVTTGTPSGVGLGLDPQIWLEDGDVVEAGIDGIGSITNTVRAV